jgi:hypothetical protein
MVWPLKHNPLFLLWYGHFNFLPFPGQNFTPISTLKLNVVCEKYSVLKILLALEFTMVLANFYCGYEVSKPSDEPNDLGSQCPQTRLWRCKSVRLTMMVQIDAL